MSIISQTFQKISKKVPLGLYNVLLKKDFIVINYHMVSDKKLPHVENLFAYKTAEMFKRDLFYLQGHFNLVSYDQLIDHVNNGKSLSKKAVALTFDDGLAECYSVVRPILLEHGIPCTFFVNTSYIDNYAMANEQKVSLCIDRVSKENESGISNITQSLREITGIIVASKQELISLLKFTGIDNPLLVNQISGILELDFRNYLLEYQPYLTTDRIQKMNAEGFTIGSHSSEHKKFSLLTDIEIEKSMADSCSQIGKLTGMKAVPFAFPHNADGVSRKLLSQILNDHPIVGLLFDANGIRSEERFLISRLNGDRSHKGEEGKSDIALSIKKAYTEEIASRWYRHFLRIPRK